MSQRPSLKLKLSTIGHPPAQQSLTTPSSATPKLKLKFSSSIPKTSAPPVPSSASDPQPTISKPRLAKKPKRDRPPRLSNPTSKKRDFAAHSGDEEPGNAASSTSRPQIKKIKLNARAPTTPFIRVKAKGKPPHRPIGVGYDSEASDREIDPAIEEEFILRMLPGEDCEYLRKAVEEKRWGPRSEGGADIRMKFLARDGRRAVITIKGRHYAACLVDLPCVIEGMKSWDRRGWWKSADICQMLLVLGRVQSEDEAMVYTLPGKELDKTTWQYAHGLTPPMRWVRRRRFRERISNRTIEAVEEEVDRLLRADDDCVGESRYEVLDLGHLSQDQSARAESEEGGGGGGGGYGLLGNAGMQGGSDYGEQDAEGDADDASGYFDRADEEQDALAADLEMAMMESEADDAVSVSNIVTGAVATTLLEGSNDVSTPATVSEALTTTPSKGEDTGDESSSGDDDDDDDDDEEGGEGEDGAEEVDEDVLEQQQDLQRQREEIADLEAAITSQTREFDKIQNPILKGKLMRKIQSLKGDLDLKRAAIGEGGDD
ncbi:hypothetical protein MMC06_004695 [Schaereria dolodes]|nr:hypothetical protein [Schaereria dolodes]